MPRIGQISSKSNSKNKKNEKLSSGGMEGVESITKKHRKQKPGQGAVKEIKRLQNSVGSIFPAVAVRRVIKEIAEEFKDGVRFEKLAIQELHAIAENFLHELFMKTCIMTKSADRVTCQKDDILNVLKIDSRLSKMYATYIIQKEKSKIEIIEKKLRDNANNVRLLTGENTSF